MLQHTKEAKRLYKSAKWSRCRRSYIQSVFGMCERCGQSGVIVHHKVWINSVNVNDPTVTLNHSNLEYLCLLCHNRQHFGTADVLRDDVMFDSEGNLIKRSEG
jgi:5-methylcytosine-specific restriction protein A